MRFALAALLAAVTAVNVDAERLTELEASAVELEAVTWEMERRGLIAPDFHRYQVRTRPGFSWDYPHFRYIHGRYDAVTRGEVERLLLQVAIRHGKTETIQGYATYSIERDLSTRVLLCTYSHDQAKKVSRIIRRMARGRGIELSRDADSATEWETIQGGGLRAVGVGTGVASVNADLILIDDPIGSRRDAESEAHREAVWLWLTTDILARATPGTKVIFSMPRWHADDPSGRLQRRQKGRWELIDMPGVALDDDMLGRAPGELLWPEFRPEEFVRHQKMELGPYGFASAVQCRPVPREGGMFKWDWLKDCFVDVIPRSVVKRVRYWDLAGTEGDGDFTAGSRVSLGTDGLFYIEHVQRGQWAPGRRDEKIESTSREDARLPGRFEVGLEEDTGVNGKERTRAVVARLNGLSVTAERPTGSKEVRADPVAGQMQVGNVRIVRGDWNEAFLDELLTFPSGLHDDQVDATSGGFKLLSQPSPHVTFIESPWG